MAYSSHTVARRPPRRSRPPRRGSNALSSDCTISLSRRHALVTPPHPGATRPNGALIVFPAIGTQCRRAVESQCWTRCKSNPPPPPPSPPPPGHPSMPHSLSRSQEPTSAFAGTSSTRRRTSRTWRLTPASGLGKAVVPNGRTRHSRVHISSSGAVCSAVFVGCCRRRLCGKA